MIKIGVDIDEKLIILLKEMLDYEFINTNVKVAALKYL